VARYEGVLHEITPEWREYLRTKIGFDDDHIESSRVRLGDHNRVAYPIISPLGRVRGWVLRSYDDYIPKASTHPDEPNVPNVSYYTASGWARGPVAYLVEDIPSAVRASRYVDAVALLGTSASVSAIAEIAGQYRDIVWALDGDAIGHALQNSLKFSIFFDSSRVMMLGQDFKDMNEDDLQAILGENHE
jgi:hypothetical protein